MHRHLPKTLFQCLWRPTPTQPVVGTPFELLELGHRRPRVPRDPLQVHLSMIPCPRIESFSKNIELESKAVHGCCPLPQPIGTVVRGWVKHDNTEPGSGAGTQRRLAALSRAAQPSRPSPGVHSHEGSLDRRFGQLMVPRSGR